MAKHSKAQKKSAKKPMKLTVLRALRLRGNLTLSGQKMTRADVFAIEKQMLAMQQIEIPVTHEYIDGYYHRTGTIPAGVTATGGIHKYENLNQLKSGQLSVRMEDGSIVRMTAPAEIRANPGSKRIFYAHTDCVLTTILKTDLTDHTEIERLFIAPDEQAYLSHVAALQLEGK